jgi:hypothetical protein
MKNAEGEDILVPEGQSKIWNYHPNLPVPNSPVFRWRPRIGFVLNWFRNGWFALSGATIWVALAFVVFTWFQPSLAQWSIGGIILMLLRNLFLIFIIAGGLHLWLWSVWMILRWALPQRLKFWVPMGKYTVRSCAVCRCMIQKEPLSGERTQLSQKVLSLGLDNVNL